jgi:hypothetical protein
MRRSVVTRSKQGTGPTPMPEACGTAYTANDDSKPAPPPAASAIVTIRLPGPKDVVDLTPEEHHRRGGPGAVPQHHRQRPGRRVIRIGADA